MNKILYFGAALGLLSGACGPSEGGDAGSEHEGGLMPCMETLSLDGGEAGEMLFDLDIPAGAARAGRIAETALPRDTTGLSLTREGDFVLANEHVAVFVEAAGDSDGVDPWGGRLIGLSVRTTSGEMVAVDYNEMIPALGRFTIGTLDVSVLRDGMDGGAAIVRARGVMEPIPLVEAFARNLFPQDFAGLEAAMDYVLEPGAEHVDVRLRLMRNRPEDSAALTVGQPTVYAFQANRLDLSRGGQAGFDLSGASDEGVLYFSRPGEPSYAWADPGGEIVTLLSVANLNIFRTSRFELPACEVSDHFWHRVHIGGPSLAGLQEAVARSGGDATTNVRGRVLEADGTPAAGVRVHAVSGESYLGRALSDDEGRFALPVGAEVGAIELTTWRDGDYPVRASGSATGPFEVMMGARGRARVEIREAATGESVPARVQIVPLDEGRAAPSPDPRFGERVLRAGRLVEAFPSDGVWESQLPVGRYQMIVSRGFEYEAVTHEIEITDGGTQSREVILEQTVHTPDSLCGDFHIHTHRSFDTEDPVSLKVRAAAAQGVELPVRSDHEWVADFEPEIWDAGLENYLYGIASLELTSFNWGHMGVFPLTPAADQPNAGALRWYERRPPEVFDEARSRMGEYGAAAIIINHPRGGGALLSYFDAAGYDPITGEVARPDLWDDEFRLVEVFNASGFDANAEGTVRDWFALLNQGRSIFAVGSSDSHEVASTPVGYPRTCVPLGVNDAASARRLGAGVVRDAMLAGQHFISGGIVVQTSARDGVEMGGTVTGAAERELVRVDVRAPLWVPVDRLRIYVNGELAQDIELGMEDSDPMQPTMRFAGEFDLDLPMGPRSWVIAVASGTGDLSPVHPGHRPFGVTNPIFFMP